MKIQQLLDLSIALALIAYWTISARGIKRDKLRRSIPWSWLGLVAVAALFLFNWLPYGQAPMIPQNSAVSCLGISLMIAGLALAIWGRRHLGVNWSSAAAVKEDHELVTSGPYRVVRHPIYAGFLWATLGAALTHGALWVAVLAVLLLVFVRRMRIEEKLMATEFPSAYPEYQRKTKRLIPFLW